MRTIAIINQKGGCGKTTTSINLAAVLALRGHRTLLVDMDPQSHCALGLAVPETQIQQSTADLLKHGLDGTLSVDEVTWQISRGLDLAPSSMDLAMMEQHLATAPDKDRRLVQVLSTVQDRYDYCIIDCPPSIGLLTFNALRAADEVIIPVETGYFAMQGSVRQEQTIEMLVRRVGQRVRFRVLPTMYDVRTKLAREILAELKKHFGQRVLPMVINFNSKLKEAASFGQPITEYDSASRGMGDFEQLATWLQENPPAPAVPVVQDEPDAAAPHAEPADVDEPVAPAAASISRHPALSRAAELVERARALSAKSAELSDRFNQDPDRAAFTGPAAPSAPAPAPTPAPMPSRLPAITPAAAASAPSFERPAPTMTPAAQLASPPARLAAALAVNHVTRPQPAPAPRPAAAPLPTNGSIALRPEPAPAPTADPRTESLEEKLTKLYGVRQTTRGLLFVQPAEAGSNADLTPVQLAIAGDFNNWNPSQTPMTRDENLGVWRACVNVPPGRYRYRLVKNGQWVQDPFNRTVESNPFGELNNIIEIKSA